MTVAVELASSLTPHQWGTLALVLAGLFLTGRHGRRRRRRSRPRFYRRVRRVPTAAQRAFTAEQRAQMFTRDGGRCWYCGVAVHYEMNCQWVEGCDTCFEADHVIPWSKGGQTVLANGVTACRYHNRMKGDDTPDEFRAKAGRL